MGLKDERPKAREIAHTLREAYGSAAPQKAAELRNLAVKSKREDTLPDIELAFKTLAAGVW